MKMNRETFTALSSALQPFTAQGKPETTRERWDILWRSGYDVTPLYKAGLNDDHIDTALRAIFK